MSKAACAPWPCVPWPCCGDDRVLDTNGFDHVVQLETIEARSEHLLPLELSQLGAPPPVHVSGQRVWDADIDSLEALKQRLEPVGVSPVLLVAATAALVQELVQDLGLVEDLILPERGSDETLEDEHAVG